MEKYHKKYEDIYFNNEKREIIQQKKKRIQEIIVEIQNKIDDKDEMEEVVKLQLEIKGISEYIQREIYEYLQNMDESDKKAYLIAMNHLGSSFNIYRSNGFKEWKQSKKNL